MRYPAEELFWKQFRIRQQLADPHQGKRIFVGKKFDFCKAKGKCLWTQSEVYRNYFGKRRKRKGYPGYRKTIGRAAFQHEVQSVLSRCFKHTARLASDVANSYEDRDEHIRQIGELARIFTDSGQIFITSIFNLDDYEAKKLKLLNQPMKS